jgi:pimeloyl-ACP methyl ester carboxylesterase
MGEHVRAGDLDIWTEQVGEGPDVLLIGGAGDTVESWQFQLDGLADRYRLTAFDNRGAGRTAMPDEPVSIEAMADDAALSSARWTSARPTWRASRAAASSPRSWRYATPSSCSASSSRAPGRRWTSTTARGFASSNADLIRGAQFEVLEEEAHQPFQEIPDEWNARVDAFWREVEARK